MNPGNLQKHVAQECCVRVFASLFWFKTLDQPDNAINMTMKVAHLDNGDPEFKEKDLKFSRGNREKSVREKENSIWNFEKNRKSHEE